jgi:hypothetical protein
MFSDLFSRRTTTTADAVASDEALTRGYGGTGSAAQRTCRMRATHGAGAV